MNSTFNFHMTQTKFTTIWKKSQSTKTKTKKNSPKKKTNFFKKCENFHRESIFYLQKPTEKKNWKGEKEEETTSFVFFKWIIDARQTVKSKKKGFWKINFDLHTEFNFIVFHFIPIEWVSERVNEWERESNKRKSNWRNLSSQTHTQIVVVLVASQCWINENLMKVSKVANTKGRHHHRIYLSLSHSHRTFTYVTLLKLQFFIEKKTFSLVFIFFLLHSNRKWLQLCRWLRKMD